MASGNPYEALTEKPNPYAGMTDAQRATINILPEDPGALGAASIKAGETVDRIVQGTKAALLAGKKRYLQMRGDTAGADAVQKQIDELNASLAENREIAAPIAQQHPLASALGGAAPYSVPVGGIVSSGLTAGTAASLAAEPGQGLAEGVKQGILAGAGAGLGGALSGAVSPGQRVLGRNVLTAQIGGPGGLIDRARGFYMPDATGQILRNMEARGYTPYVSELGGSTTARQAEDYLSRAPGSSGVMADFAEGNRAAVNTAAAQAIGERARNVSAEVLDNAATRIGQTFERVASLPGHPIGLNQDVARAATEVLRQQGMRPVSADPVLQRVAQQIQTYAQHNGRLTGEAYNALRSDLSAAANAAHRGGNSAAGRGYDALLEALDGSAAASLTVQGQGELAGALRTARSEYGNLMTLERGRTVTAGGDVTPSLASVMRQKYPRQFREGNMEGNPLFDIARYFETYPQLRSGSQTFERQAIQDIAEAPAAIASGAERAGPSLVGLATAPVNWLGAQYMTSPVARFLSRRGVLGEPTTSFTTGVLSDAVIRDILNGMPGSLGVVNPENY